MKLPPPPPEIPMEEEPVPLSPTDSHVSSILKYVSYFTISLGFLRINQRVISVFD